MANTTAQPSLTERLAVLKNTDSLDYFEIARELTELHQHRNSHAVRKLRDAYVAGLTRAYPRRKPDNIKKLVGENLYLAAGLADIVASCGYEASGQLTALAIIKPRLPTGPIETFYQEATGYKLK